MFFVLYVPFHKSRKFPCIGGLCFLHSDNSHKEDGRSSRRHSPSEGGDENRYLRTFLDARRRVMRKEEAHSDLSRINAQRNLLKQGNYNLTLPLHWTMYGDSFTLTQTDIDAME